MAGDNEVVIRVRAFDETKDAFTSATNRAKGLGQAAAGPLRLGFLGAGAAMASVIGTTMKFEHAVDQVGAVANATEKEMADLGKTALRIGKETAFSATESAQAMEILAAAGVSVEDILGGAADAAVALAAAGGTDLKTAADAAATSMAVWNLQASDMTDVVNRLAGAANVSRFGVEDMSGAIAMGGGAAASAGVEFGDFAAAIAATASSFSSGSDAGTSFKQFLNGLTPNAITAKDAMRDLGLITAEGKNQFFDAAGQLKSMAEITQILHEATAGLTEEQKAQALETIFGSDAMRTAAAISKLTGDEFQVMSDKMKNTDAQEVAAKRMGNLKGSTEQLMGGLETLQIQIGTALMPVLVQLVKFLTDEALPAFEKIFNFLKENEAVAIGVATAIGVLAIALFPIPAAITAIITAGILLIEHWDKVIAKANELSRAIPDALGIPSGGGPQDTIRNQRNSFLDMIGLRAEGGPVMGGAPYIVGERGPELFVPGSSGQIVPNGAMGGQTVNINFNVFGSIHSDRDIEQIIRDSMRGGGFSDVFATI